MTMFFPKSQLTTGPANSRAEWTIVNWINTTNQSRPPAGWEHILQIEWFRSSSHTTEAKFIITEQSDETASVFLMFAGRLTAMPWIWTTKRKNQRVTKEMQTKSWQTEINKTIRNTFPNHKAHQITPVMLVDLAKGHWETLARTQNVSHELKTNAQVFLESLVLNLMNTHSVARQHPNWAITLTGRMPKRDKGSEPPECLIWAANTQEMTKEEKEKNTLFFEVLQKEAKRLMETEAFPHNRSEQITTQSTHPKPAPKTLTAAHLAQVHGWDLVKLSSHDTMAKRARLKNHMNTKPNLTQMEAHI